MTSTRSAGSLPRWLRDGGRERGLLLAAALVIATNAVVIAGVGLNRRGAPDASLTLTERELHLAYADSENTGLSLDLEWNGGGWGAGPDWFDRTRLEALGFDCSKPLGDEDAELWYDKMLPRQHYAVLEYGGTSWQAWLDDSARELKELRAEVERGEEPAQTLRERENLIAAKRLGLSRLFLIDAGADARILRQRYPDPSRFLIAPAKIQLHYRKDWDSKTNSYGEPYLRGAVSELLVASLHVPRRLRGVPDAVRDEDRRTAEERQAAEARRAAGKSGGAELLPDPEPWYLQSFHPPRYRVEVRYGRRHESWIETIERLPQGDAAAVALPAVGAH